MSLGLSLSLSLGKRCLLLGLGLLELGSLLVLPDIQKLLGGDTLRDGTGRASLELSLLLLLSTSSALLSQCAQPADRFCVRARGTQRRLTLAVDDGLVEHTPHL